MKELLLREKKKKIILLIFEYNCEKKLFIIFLKIFLKILFKCLIVMVFLKEKIL